VLRVHETSLLNVFTALSSHHFGKVAKLLMLDGLHADTIAMLFAISEKRRCCEDYRSKMSADQEPWPPWGDLLVQAPALSDTPQLLAWPSEAVAALGDAQVLKVVQDAQASLWQLARQVSESRRRLSPEVAACLRGAVDFDDLLWARCLFDSRAVAVSIEAPASLQGLALSGGESVPPLSETRPKDAAGHGLQWLLLQNISSKEEQPQAACWVQCPLQVSSLVPGVDLLNHSAHAACASPRFCSHRRALVVSTVAAVSAGADICICYGALQNWELLLYYGFCPESNPHDRIVICLDDDIQASEEQSDESGSTEAAARQIVMQLHGIPTDHALWAPPVPGLSTACPFSKSVMEAAAASSAGAAASMTVAVCGWQLLGPISPQLLRCLRVLLSEDGPQSVDLSAPPGAADSLALDVQCLVTLEELLGGLLAPLQEGPPAASAEPLWWPLYGQLVGAFRRSQHALLSANVAAVRGIREKLQQQLLATTT